MPRHRSTKKGALPKALVRLIDAARKSTTDGEGGDISGAPGALRDFGALALWALPVHGVFVPNNTVVEVGIARIAREHLGLKRAEREFRDALGAVESFEQRDPIESAHHHVQSESDQAYFYAGLAFGLTLKDFS
jgi:hypothetical protein